MAPSTTKPPRRPPQPPRTPTTPSKTVTLKLKVNDADLAHGLFRSPPTASSTPAITSTSISSRPAASTVRRRARGRPKSLNLDFDTVRDLVPVDFEAWEEQYARREREFEPPGLDGFRAVSVLTFPVKMKMKIEAEPGSEHRVQEQGQGPVRIQERDEDEDRVPPPGRCCAACGVPALPDSHTPQSQLQPQPQHQYSRIDPSSALTPPWSRIQLRPRRHVDLDTNSVVDLVVLRSGPVPQTVGFWYDVTIGEIAKRVDDVDFKMLCLNLIRWRAENEVDEGLVRDVFGREKEGCHGWQQGETVRAEYTTVWDDVLVDAVVRGKIWRKRRRWMEKEREKAAGWAVWETRVRNYERGEFVDDGGVGAWILRVPRLGGRARRVLKLGYRRLGEDEEFEKDGLGKIMGSLRHDKIGEDDVDMIDAFGSIGGGKGRRKDGDQLNAASVNIG